jgi:transposase
MPLPRPKHSKAKPKRRRPTTWAQLEERLEDIGGKWQYGEILNLPNWKTIKYKETDDDLFIQAELTTEATTICDNCGTPTSEFGKWGFTELTYVRDLEIRHKRVRVYFCLQRKRCPCKRKTVQQPLTGVDDCRAMTTRLLEYVQRESLNIFRTLSEIGDDVGCSEQTVRNILCEYCERLQQERCEQLKKNGFIDTPKWIALDEVQPQWNGTQFCVISDPLGRRVLDLIPNTTKELAGWLLRLDRLAVEVVTMDMWAPYRAIVRRLFPNAHIVVDRYHVHNLLSVALKKVLDVIRDHMSYSEQRRYMRAEFFLLKNYRRLSDQREEDEDGKELPSEKELVEKWLEDVPDIAKAYALVKDFSDILQLTDRPKAEELTDQWLERAVNFMEYFRGKYQKRCGDKWQDPFGNIPGTISEWRHQILNYIDFKDRFRINATNGFAEFANKQIKRAYAVGGYDPLVLRFKVVFGGVLRKRRPPHPLEDKLPRAKRKSSDSPGRRGRRSSNPNSNLARLKEACESEDVTKGLLDDPREKRDWVDRFGQLLPPSSGSGTERQVSTSGTEEIRENHKVQHQPTPKKSVVRRRVKHNSDQLKFFRT